MKSVTVLKKKDVDYIDIYTDGLCKSNVTNNNSINLGTRIDLGVYFPSTEEHQDNYLFGSIQGKPSGIRAELGAILLALECIPHDSTVNIFLDSMAAILAISNIKNYNLGKNVNLIKT